MPSTVPGSNQGLLSPASSHPFFPDFFHPPLLTIPLCFSLKGPRCLLNPLPQEICLPDRLCMRDGPSIHENPLLLMLFCPHTLLDLAKFIHIFLSPPFPQTFPGLFCVPGTCLADRLVAGSCLVRAQLLLGRSSVSIGDTEES